MKKGREILKKYHKTGKYLFHGSDRGDIKVFKPRQAYNQDSIGKKYKDGNPAIFASKDIEIPIFFAIFNHKNIDIEDSSFRTSEYKGEIILSATENKIDFFNRNSIKGYVYVFEKKDFHERDNDSMGLVCEREIESVDMVQVENRDVILNIKEIK